MRTILIVIVAAAVMWLSSNSVGVSSSTSAIPKADCLQALRAEYTPKWAEMSALQRAMVGVQAASCGDK